MRKILLIILGLLLVFIAFVYLSVSETSDNFRTCEVLSIDDLDATNFRQFDSVTVAANLLYEASFLKEIMQGEQYREAWAAPVTVPIAFLDTLKGGLKIIEEGGGKQTHSLELEDKKGIRYALRSLSKDPEPLVPEVAKDLNLENVVIDGVSAQHPYAALVVAQLSENANVLHTQPKLVFVPKQKTLGELNAKYGNRLYFLEYESEGKVDWTGLEGVKELIDTEDLLQIKAEKGIKINIDHNELIRARLFDLIIGDWDRHAKQWGWVLQELDGKFYAKPIPTDRDNAFFKQDGVLPTLIANDALHPKLQSFEAQIDHLPGLVTSFDEYFLRSTTRAQFEKEAGKLKELLSDDKITMAFYYWPKVVDSLNGPEIREKLKARRDNINEIAAQFYKLLKQRPKKDIVLKGCEDLELKGILSNCFDCTEKDFEFKEGEESKP